MPCRAVTSRAVPGHAARHSAWRCVLHNWHKFTPDRNQRIRRLYFDWWWQKLLGGKCQTTVFGLENRRKYNKIVMMTFACFSYFHIFYAWSSTLLLWENLFWFLNPISFPLLSNFGGQEKAQIGLKSKGCEVV
jgi:hypothetical protein